jgi:hypothetical protein
MRCRFPQFAALHAGYGLEHAATFGDNALSVYLNQVGIAARRDMKDQMHIRNTEAARRAQVRRWRRLLAIDRRHVRKPDIPIQALYKQSTGLPKKAVGRVS